MRACAPHVGEPVAAVFADDPYRAEDAAERVVLDIEELAPILSASDVPGAFDDRHSTNRPLSRSTAISPTRFAMLTPSSNSTSGRHSGVPLETRGAIGRYDAGNDIIELHGAAKVPDRNQEQIAKLLSRAVGFSAAL